MERESATSNMSLQWEGHVRDQRIMEKIDSTRFTSLVRVTMGVGSVSWHARIEAESRGRLLQPTLLDDVVSMIFTKTATYLT